MSRKVHAHLKFCVVHHTFSICIPKTCGSTDDIINSFSAKHMPYFFRSFKVCDGLSIKWVMFESVTQYKAGLMKNV